jgi:hypothetical protein
MSSQKVLVMPETAKGLRQRNAGRVGRTGSGASAWKWSLNRRGPILNEECPSKSGPIHNKKGAEYD